MTDSPAGFTYKADTYCPHHALHLLEEDMGNPLFDVGVMFALDMDEAAILEVAAGIMEIDHHNPHSYDSDVFPKPFGAEEADPKGYCPITGCGIRFIDGVKLRPLTVTGIILADRTAIACHLLPGHVGKAVYGCLDITEDGIDRWTAQVMAETPDEAVAEAMAMMLDRQSAPM